VISLQEKHAKGPERESERGWAWCCQNFKKTKKEIDKKGKTNRERQGGVVNGVTSGVKPE